MEFALGVLVGSAVGVLVGWTATTLLHLRWWRLTKQRLLGFTALPEERTELHTPSLDF